MKRTIFVLSADILFFESSGLFYEFWLTIGTVKILEPVKLTNLRTAMVLIDIG